MPADHGFGFLGRTSERDRLDGMLADVRAGRSAALVIRGEAGVGKTALLRYAGRQASGLRVAEIAGVEAEMELAFAGIHRLCTPMLARADVLPEPQRNALEVALGLASGEPPDRFLVALAVLGLLCAVAEERALVCLVDDAHWLDTASGQLLGFVARRLLAEPLAMVFGLREPVAARTFDRLPELAIGGLQAADARALLARARPGRLDDRIRDRLIAETRGNPLAILELPQGPAATQLPGGFGLPATDALSGRIEESFLRRLDDMPQATRTLLLVAAAEPAGDPGVMWRAATRLGVAATALEPAVRTGLLDVGARVRFRHPLVRSAVYRSASDAERRSAHGALADATDAALEPDRRAWHRAQATSGPDEDLSLIHI